MYSRKKNGDALRDKMRNITGSWRTGKFLPLSLRPFSANSYALSKVWFRCSTVNLREGDISQINSSIKKWLYSDLLFKPEELLLFRHASQGGLGLISVKLKAQAHFLRTFLDLAANPSYLNSMYLNAIYRSKVLGEEIACPPLPPYYQNSMFALIREAIHSGHQVSTMRTKQWYLFLHKREFSSSPDDDQPCAPLPCKIQILEPNILWDRVWWRIRHPSLHSEVQSFGWMLVHRLLPVEEKIHNKIGNIDASCRYFCPGNILASLEHCLFECCLTEDIGSWVFTLVKASDPTACANSILSLDFHGPEHLLWIVLNSLHFSWKNRRLGKLATMQDLLFTLKYDLEILATTSFTTMAAEVLSLLAQYDPP